jgi:hypothetical protein
VDTLQKTPRMLHWRVGVKVSDGDMSGIWEGGRGRERQRETTYLIIHAMKHVGDVMDATVAEATLGVIPRIEIKETAEEADVHVDGGLLPKGADERVKVEALLLDLAATLLLAGLFLLGLLGVDKAIASVDLVFLNDLVVRPYLV